MDQEAAKVVVEIHQEIVDGSVVAFPRSGKWRPTDLFEDDLVDGPLAEIFGDLGRRIVCAEGLLVDVLLKDVPEHVGIDLIVVLAGHVIEVPRVSLEKGEDIFEGLIRDGDIGVVDLDLVGQEEAAIEILDLPENLAGFRAALVLGLGKAFEEQELQEAVIKEVTAQFLGGFELVLQIFLVVVVDESFLL